MKRLHTILVLTLALSLLATSACLAVFPKPDSFIGYTMKQGWFQDDVAWYIHYDNATNDIDFAKWGQPYTWLSKKLSSALEGVTPAARPMYIVLNYQQGPVFSAAPGDPEYSGLWQVVYVTWHDGFARPITNAEPATMLNPQGVPDATEAEVVETGVVIQYPIVALGQLDGPWYPVTPGKYRMKQVIASSGYAYSKQIILPVYFVYCTDPTGRYISVTQTTIPDVSDQVLADWLGANLAPGLLNVPDTDTTDFWYMNNPKPAFQYPVVKDCPTPQDHFNLYTDYSPVMRYVVLDRMIPPYAVIKSSAYVEKLIGSGGLVIDSDTQRLGVLTFTPLPM